MGETERLKASREATTVEGGDLAALLNKEFRPQTERARQEVEGAVRALAEQALKSTPTMSTDVVETIRSMIAEIDQTLTGQINQILHHPDFQKLEGAWRGLHYLVSNTASDEMLKIRVMNV